MGRPTSTCSGSSHNGLYRARASAGMKDAHVVRQKEEKSARPQHLRRNGRGGAETDDAGTSRGCSMRAESRPIIRASSIKKEQADDHGCRQVHAEGQDIVGQSGPDYVQSQPQHLRALEKPAGPVGVDGFLKHGRVTIRSTRRSHHHPVRRGQRLPPFGMGLDDARQQFRSALRRPDIDALVDEVLEITLDEMRRQRRLSSYAAFRRKESKSDFGMAAEYAICMPPMSTSSTTPRDRPSQLTGFRRTGQQTDPRRQGCACRRTCQREQAQPSERIPSSPPRSGSRRFPSPPLR